MGLGLLALKTEGKLQWGKEQEFEGADIAGENTHPILNNSGRKKYKP